MRPVILCAVGVFLFLAGCGGGSGSATAEEGRDYTFGPVTTRAVGGVQQPVTLAGANSVVTGVFGANFTNLTANLLPDNQLYEDEIDNQSMIALSYVNRPRFIEMETLSTVIVNPEVGVFSNNCTPSFSANGGQMVTSEYDPPTGNFQIYTMNLDGSNRFKVTTGGGFSPSLSPIASKIVFSNGGEIWSVNTNGTFLTNLTNTADYEYSPKFSPDGTKIGYLKAVGLDYEFWDMTAAGASQSGRFPGVVIDLWDWEPAGNSIVHVLRGVTNYVYRRNITTASANVVYSTSDDINGMTVSPTGSRIALDVTVGGASRQLRLLKLSDASIGTVHSFLNNEFLGDWGGFGRKRQFVGAAGVMHTNAAGFLYGVSGRSFRSLLTFDAVTRNTVDIDVEPVGGTNPSNFVATITAADSINMLRYVNGFVHPKVTVADPAVASTHLQGAIVTYDAATGKIYSVLGFNRSRGGAKPVRSESDGRATYTGDIQCVFDSEGKRVSGPVSSVSVDVKTGELLR